VPTPRAKPERAARDLRLFIALWPTAVVRAALCARREAIKWPPQASVVTDQKLHLTLHFIGQVPVALWPHLLPALQVPCRSAELEFGAALHWPHGLVVLPATSLPEPLRELHQALAGALAELGLPVERRAFQPHVTLARRAAGAVLPALAPPLRWRASGYALVNSDPAHGYRVLARFGQRGVTLAQASRTATTRSRPTPRPTPR
jgi:2'-5' RNA ligase